MQTSNTVWLLFLHTVVGLTTSHNSAFALVTIRGGQIMLKNVPIMLCSGAQKTAYYAPHYAYNFTYYAQTVLDIDERICWK